MLFVPSASRVKAEETRRGAHRGCARPTTRPTYCRPSNLTPVAFTKEVIPTFLDALTVCLDQPQELAQHPGVKAIVVRNRYLWPKPKLGLVFAAFNMNVGRLPRIALVRTESPRSGN